MVNITEMILFYSRYSSHCKGVLSFIQQFNIAVSTVAVDNKKVRERIKAGKIFKIKGVPTLIVVYDNQNAEMYEGEKVLAWLNQLVSHNAPKKQEPIYTAPVQQQTRTPLRRDFNDAQSLRNYDDNSDDEIEYLDEYSEPEQPRQKYSVKEQKAMEIKDLAKAMQQQREQVMEEEEAQYSY